MFFQSVTVSIVADLVFCFADVTDAGMAKCDQMADSIGGNGISVADDLVIIGIKRIETGINDFAEMSFHKF